MLQGGKNITDISQEEGVKLIVSYWKKQPVTINSEMIVGDVHGDLHQFLAPLVMSGLITLTGNIHEVKGKFPESSLFLPEYTINANVGGHVIYLGDLIDEWIFSRQVVHILRDLLTKLNTNAKTKVKYIYGNHDLALVGRYFLFKNGKISIPHDLPPLWETLKSELNYHRKIKIYSDKIEYDSSDSQGKEFLFDYLSVLFEDMYYIFENKLGQLSQACMINNTPFIISHSTWTINALRQLINSTTATPERPGDKDEEQLKPLISSTSTSSTKPDITFLNDIVRSKSLTTQLQTKEAYQMISTLCNELFNSQSRLFICKNGITYTRNKEGIFLNQITGHSSGFFNRNIGVNPEPATYYPERLKKLTPANINGKQIYYFDFDCSAGYDRDEISRPDFVYVTTEGLKVTNLPSFNFIISNGKQAMIVGFDKTPKTSNKLVLTS